MTASREQVVRSGRCFCGAVVFRAEGAPLFVSNCHCESCRRSASAPSVPWAGYADERVRFEGEARRAFNSSPGVTRTFCGQCGSPLSFRSDKWPGETHLPVCAFDAPDDLPPQTDYFAEFKLPWSALLAVAARPSS